MDVARIKIRSKQIEPVNTTLSILLINGEPFLIKVAEECSGSIHWGMQKVLNLVESSSGVSGGAGGG